MCGAVLCCAVHKMAAVRADTAGYQHHLGARAIWPQAASRHSCARGNSTSGHSCSKWYRDLPRAAGGARLQASCMAGGSQLPGNCLQATWTSAVFCTATAWCMQVSLPLSFDLTNSVLTHSPGTRILTQCHLSALPAPVADPNPDRPPTWRQVESA